MPDQGDDGVTVICCGPGNRICRCNCPDGNCEHVWDGRTVAIELGGGAVCDSATCSRCGMTAMSHGLRVCP